jgi:hypothetical protein
MSFFKPKSNEEIDSETKRMQFEKENLRIQHEREQKYSSAKKELNKEKYAGVHNFVTGAKEKLASMKKAQQEREKKSHSKPAKNFSMGFNNQSPKGIDHSMPGLFNREEPKKKDKRGFPFY